MSKYVSLGLLAVLSFPAAVLAAFQDVPGTHPNAEAIAYVQSQGIVQGYPDSTFRPRNAINRAEFTKILINAFYPGEANGSDCFSDVKTQWFAAEVCFARSKNIIAGYSDGTFRPAQTVNLAEAAKIVTWAAKISIPDGGGRANDPWYAPFFAALTSRGAIPATFSNASQAVTRGEMAEMVYRIKANVTNRSAATYDTFFPPVQDQPHGVYMTYSDHMAGLSAPFARRVFFFHASWCPDCRAADAALSEDLFTLPTDLAVIKVDYDTSKDLRTRYGVTTQHTFVQVDGAGNAIKKWTGGTTLSDILKQVAK